MPQKALSKKSASKPGKKKSKRNEDPPEENDQKKRIKKQEGKKEKKGPPPRVLKAKLEEEEKTDKSSQVRCTMMTAKRRLESLEPKFQSEFEVLDISKLDGNIRRKALSVEGSKETDKVLYCSACEMIIDMQCKTTAIRHVSSKSHVQAKKAEKDRKEDKEDDKKDDTKAGKQGGSTCTQQTLLKPIRRVELENDIGYASLLAGLTAWQLSVICWAFTKHLNLSLPSGRTLLNKGHTFIQPLREQTAKLWDGHFVGLGVDGTTAPGVNVACMAVIAYFAGIVLFAGMECQEGLSYTSEATAAFVRRIIDSGSICVSFYVLDRYSVNRAWMNNLEEGSKRAVVWCLGHVFNDEAKKSYRKQYPLAAEFLSDWSRIMGNALCGQRRKRWVAFQKKRNEEVAAEVKRKGDATQKLKRLLVLVKDGELPEESLAPLLPDDTQTEDLVSTAEKLAEEPEESGIHTSTPKSTPTTCDTRWCAMFSLVLTINSPPTALRNTQKYSDTVNLIMTPNTRRFIPHPHIKASKQKCPSQFTPRVNWEACCGQEG
eukprot:TRINITY_DN6201_c0_g1_i2.p1 TRINITY_DN6201_c0_g1~~TRINITY_DN6201_c0_g1_i2.p1  ORF type:complete len:543 (+),score=65.46 TRINITY_DN6201_c0_g1_i2:339-1967(+)